MSGSWTEVQIAIKKARPVRSGFYVGDEIAYFAGAAGVAAGAAAGALAGAGAAVVAAGALGVMLDTFTGVFTAKEAQMLRTQMKMASDQVAFSMKSVVLR